MLIQNMMNLRNRLKFLILLVAFLIVACSGSDKIEIHSSDIREIQLVSANSNKTMPLSELFEIESYIPLETGDSTFIGEISRLLVLDDAIWIMDEISNQIMGFSDEGKLFTVIDEKG